MEVDGRVADAGEMPKLSPDVIWRYGCAVLSAALVVVLRQVFDRVLSDRHVFFAGVLGVALVAGYGGFGPSLLALGLLALSAELPVLVFGAGPRPFESQTEVALALVCVGLPIVLLGGARRRARDRVAASVTVRDIRERNMADEALRESEHRFRTMADAIPIMIWGSGTDALCDYFNKQWLDFTGRTFEQEMGNGWSEGVHADDLKRCVDTYRFAFDAREPFLMEYRLRRHDGEYRWVLDAGVPRYGRDGTFSGYIGSCLDITDRKEAEEKLRNADRRKEEFLAVLSHELRNPLAPIRTALDLLEQGGPGRDEFRHELATINRQVQNLERLVDDLLDVSRISRGKIELRKDVVPVAEIVADSVQLVRALVDEQHQELHVSIPEEALFLNADRTRLEQILSNVLINAAKFTPRGGQIWLTAERSDLELVIRVRDTGVGIEREFLSKVFELFVQGDRGLTPSRHGAGIGLSLAKDLVELHGGTITAESQGPGAGSEFTIRLPVLLDANVAGKAAAKSIESETSHHPRRRRVLVVDDNVQAADNLGKLLSGVLGQDARVVYDGCSALEVAQSFRPEIVLLDLEMILMDGYEVARRLRERQGSSDLLIAAVTGWAQEDFRRRSQETGFDLHLVKPVTASELRAVLVDLDARTAEDHDILTPLRSSRPSSAKDALAGLGGLLRPGSR
jgi:PAS domain S-box-containing protein